MLRLEARPAPSRRMMWLSPMLAVAATAAIGIAIFALLGRDVLEAFHAFFIKPVSTVYGIGELLLKASPLMLCAVGLATAYRANVWNIGAEGQLTAGAIVGGGAALAFDGGSAVWVLPAILLAGTLGGLAWAA